MANIKTLLFVDNDAAEYDTPLALSRAIQRIGTVSWVTKALRQREAQEVLRYELPNLAIIDNDFGLGVWALGHAVENGIPVGYISAYNREGLKQQPEAMRRGIEIFEHHLVTLIQKRGKTISRDLTAEGLEESLYSFLQKYSL